MRRRQKTSPYEVRCPRCDVSFPVGQRKCIHCGGSTSHLVDAASEEAFDITHADYEFPMSSAPSTSPGHTYQDSTPIEPAQEAIFSPGGVIEGSSGITIGDSIRDAMSDSGRGGVQSEPSASESAPQSTSIVGTLIRSLGGFIWVILLIGFSLARSCED